MKHFATLILLMGILAGPFSFASIYLNKATVVLKSGTQARYFAAVKEFKIISETRKEPGNIQYKLVYKATQPNLVVFEEAWKTKADLDLHLQTAHMKKFFESINFDPAQYDVAASNVGITFTPKMGNLTYVIEVLILEGKDAF